MSLDEPKIQRGESRLRVRPRDPHLGGARLSLVTGTGRFATAVIGQEALSHGDREQAQTALCELLGRLETAAGAEA